MMGKHLPMSCTADRQLLLPIALLLLGAEGLSFFGSLTLKMTPSFLAQGL